MEFSTSLSYIGIGIGVIVTLLAAMPMKPVVRTALFCMGGLFIVAGVWGVLRGSGTERHEQKPSVSIQQTNPSHSPNVFGGNPQFNYGQGVNPNDAVTEPFGVEVRTAFVSDFGPLTFYMATYRSPLGLTVSPVFYLLFLRITNLQGISSTMRDFDVEVSEKSEGPWEELISIPLFSSRLYSLGARVPNNPVKPEDTPTLIMGPGTVRLAPMTIEDMRSTTPLRPDRILESEFAKPIPPNSPISGWVALDSRRRGGIVAEKTYFRFTLRDTAGKGGQYIVPMPIGHESGASRYVDTGMFRIDGQVADISSFHVKYYSDPFPNNR